MCVCVCVCVCSIAESCWTLCDSVGHQAPLSVGFSRQEYWSGLPFPTPRDLPNTGMEPASPAVPGIFFTSEPPGQPCWHLALGNSSLMRAGVACTQ